MKRKIREITQIIRQYAPFLIGFKNYTIGICLIIKDENEYLEEWIKYHRAIGINYFYIYDNNSKEIATSLVSDTSDVEIISWTDNAKGSQMRAYKHCCTLTKLDKIAFIDTDEFITLAPQFNTIQNCLRFLERKNGLIENLGVYWRMYGQPQPYFTTRQPISNYTHYFKNEHIKSILNPKHLICFEAPHMANLKPQTSYRDEINNPIKDHKGPHTSQYIWIKHIWTRSLEEFQAKINRGTGDYGNHVRTMNDFYIHNDKCLLKD